MNDYTYILQKLYYLEVIIPFAITASTVYVLSIFGISLKFFVEKGLSNHSIVIQLKNICWLL